jgi:hypothetical protein
VNRLVPSLSITARRHDPSSGRGWWIHWFGVLRWSAGARRGGARLSAAAWFAVLAASSCGGATRVLIDRLQRAWHCCPNMVVPAPRAERKPADQSTKADRHLTRRTQENFEHLWGQRSHHLREQCSHCSGELLEARAAAQMTSAIVIAIVSTCLFDGFTTPSRTGREPGPATRGLSSGRRRLNDGYRGGCRRRRRWRPQ